MTKRQSRRRVKRPKKVSPTNEVLPFLKEIRESLARLYYKVEYGSTTAKSLDEALGQLRALYSGDRPAPTARNFMVILDDLRQNTSKQLADLRVQVKFLVDQLGRLGDLGKLTNCLERIESQGFAISLNGVSLRPK